MLGHKIQVLYVTSVPIVGRDNGGSIVCREHVRRLSELEDVRLDVCFLGGEAGVEPTIEFLDGLNVKPHPVCFRPTNAKRQSRLERILDLGLRWPIPGERTAHIHSYIDADFQRVVQAVQPEVIVVDYLMSAHFVPSAYAAEIPVITITLNREADFHRENRKARRLSPDVSSSIFGEMRMDQFERRIYRRSTAVVALSPGDAPTHENPSKVFIIEPTVGRADHVWSANRSRDLLYVGNIAHHPNFLAVKWIAEQFADHFKELAPGSSIRIIGADAQQVPAHWRRGNIIYLGASDRRGVDESMATCGLFIAPIENNFGSKMKIMECASVGTPIFATKEALSGVPFRDEIPQFSLENPDAAARAAAFLLTDTSTLEKLSVSLHRLYGEMDSSRPALWSRMLHNVVLEASHLNTQKLAQPSP